MFWSHSMINHCETRWDENQQIPQSARTPCCLLSSSALKATRSHTNVSKSNVWQACFLSRLILVLTNSIIKYDSLHIDCGGYRIVGSFWRLIWANIFLVALWNSIGTNGMIYASNTSTALSGLGIPLTHTHMQNCHITHCVMNADHAGPTWNSDKFIGTNMTVPQYKWLNCW